jgi:hypothetical protein
MSIVAVTVRDFRLFVTTDSSPSWAGTDGRIELHYRDDSGPKQVILNNPGDDRERRKTDRYDVDLGGPLDRHPIPLGIHYKSWNELLLEKSVALVTRSHDAWKVRDCYLLGNVAVTHLPTGAIDPELTSLGWYLLDRVDASFVMSRDPGEGVAQFQFDFRRGAFPTPAF